MDLEFRTADDMEQVFAGGEWRKLFDCERKTEPGSLFSTFDASKLSPERYTTPTIPESQWVDIDKSDCLVGIKDQDGIGSCLCNAVAGAMEDVAVAGGLAPIRLCAEQLYGQVAWPSDRGSDFEEDLKAVCQVGIAPESMVPAGQWNPSKWPGGWKTAAKKYRALKVFDCPTPQHVASAAQIRGIYVVLGVSVTAAFKPDSSGIIHPYRVGGVNHGVREVGMKKISGAWYFDMVNSWGTSWGVKGRAWFPYASLPKNCPVYAIAEVVTPSDELL